MGRSLCFHIHVSPASSSPGDSVVPGQKAARREACAIPSHHRAWEEQRGRSRCMSSEPINHCQWGHRALLKMHRQCRGERGSLREPLLICSLGDKATFGLLISCSNYNPNFTRGMLINARIQGPAARCRVPAVCQAQGRAAPAAWFLGAGLSVGELSSCAAFVFSLERWRCLVAPIFHCRLSHELLTRFTKALLSLRPCCS